MKAYIIGGILAVLTMSHAHAAVITWGSPTAVSTGPVNSSDVSTNRTLVEAFNGAISSYGGGDQTVNGVLFRVSTDLLDQDTAATVDFSSATNGGDASYDAILSTVDFGGGDSTTITVGDGDGDSTVSSPGLLTIGTPYEIQVWFVDDRDDAGRTFDERTMGFASSASDSIVSLNDQFVIGTFTADATTQELYLDTIAPSTGFGNAHITAYQIREIPEPSAMLMSVVSALALLRRRR